METTVIIDGQEVKFRASAAVPRLYRIKFGRDIIQDFQTVQKAVERAQETAKIEGVSEPAQPSSLTMEALELFENMAYIMAKHADKDAVPGDPDEWLERFGVFSIYGVFPVIRALWERNTEALDIAKKKLGQLTGT